MKILIQNNTYISIANEFISFCQKITGQKPEITSDSDSSDDLVEIVYPLDIDFYYIRYVRKPRPIVLENLPNGLEVNGVSYYSSCELHSALHKLILNNAVALALRSRGIYNTGNKEQ